MKGATLILQLAALSSAFVIPNEQINELQHVAIESRPAPSVLERLPTVSEIYHDAKKALGLTPDEIAEIFGSVAAEPRHILDAALAKVKDVEEEVYAKIPEAYEHFDVDSWMNQAVDEFNTKGAELFDRFGTEDDHKHHGPPEAPEQPPHHGPGDHDDPPHHGPPHDGPPHHGPPHDGPPHHGPPHDGPPHDGPPHHGPPFHHRSNLTIYQLISTSNYTTKFTKLIDTFPDIVEALNSTDAGNITIFAPTDRAFEKIPEHHHKPSKEILKKILSYHISPDFYPAGRVLVTKTIPTLLTSTELGDRPLPQRLSTNIGVRGLTVNFYSRIVAVDIVSPSSSPPPPFIPLTTSQLGSNGVIHGIDSILLPPPDILKILTLLPSEFSTLELGLTKTGLLDELNGTHAGGTFFAPSNFAFQKLGPRINAFLFSAYGQKYLKALLTYHVVREGHTLYSDAYYAPGGGDDHKIFKRSCHGRRAGAEDDHHDGGHHDHDGDDDHHDPPHGPPHGPPKGLFHVELPTLLEGKSLNIDIARYGRLIDIRINGFSHVVVSDGVAKDGVIQVVGDVLIPPKKLGEMDIRAEGGDVEEMSVEELKERLEPYVQEESKGWFDL